MESGGKEQNYWPGFVDALSNVVLTLVFVLVIFVFALVMASNKVEQKMQEIVAAQQEQKAAQSASSAVALTASQTEGELRQQLAAAQAQIEKLREQIATSASDKLQHGSTAQNAVASQNENMHIEIEDKDQAKTKQGALDVKQDTNKITLGYPLQVAEMDAKSAIELGHVLEAKTKSIGKHRVLIKSYIGKEAYSAAKRLAYYRAIGARNFLIIKGGESPNNITTTIVQPPQPEDGRVEIIIQKE